MDGKWRFHQSLIEWRLDDLDGVTKQQCAAFMGVSPGYFSKLLSGDKKPTGKHVMALAQCIGMKPTLIAEPLELEAAA